MTNELKVIIADLDTFGSKVETEFKKFFSKAPTVLQIADSVVTFAAPEVEAIVAALAPAAEPEVAAIASTVESDLATLAAACKSEATATTASQAVTNLQASLPALLTVAKVSNSTLVSKIETVVDKLLPEFIALGAAFLPAVAAL